MVTPQNEDGIDLLDILIAIAEAGWLLLIVPFIMAALTAGILLYASPQYVAEAIGRFDSQIDMITARSTLVPVIEKLGLQEEYGPQLDQAVANVRQQISVEKLGNGLIRIQAKFSSPILARDMLAVIIEQIRRQSIPRYGEKLSLEGELASLTQAVTLLKRYVDIIQEASNSSSDPDKEEGKARSLAILINDIVAKEDRIRSVKQRLEGIGPESVIVEPTLPDRATPTNIIAFSTIVAFTTGLGLLAAILIRQSFRRAVRTTLGAEKIDRLRAALKLRSKKTRHKGV